MSSPTPAETSAGVAVGLHRRIPMRISRYPAIHKKPQSPQTHISQAIYCSPCLADPHAPRIPIQAMFQYVSADPSYGQPAPKNPTPNSARSAPWSRKSIPNQSRRFQVFPVRRGTAPWCPRRHAAAYAPSSVPGHAVSAETSDRSPQMRIRPTYSNPNVQPLGGMGDDDAASTSTTTGGGGSTCVMIGPKG